jgi:predicted phosphodiesterase
MRIQQASDIHLEFIERVFAGERLVEPAPDADLLVLAGDIANGTRGVELFADWPVPVLYVAGNHEAYEGVLETTLADLVAAAIGTSVIVLDHEVIDLTRLRQFEQWAAPRRDELARLRFLGCTLWTDYRFGGTSQAEAMADCERMLTDHRLIRTASGPFTASYALQQHTRSRAWLETELARPFDGRTVVITHHAPHPLSVHARFAGNPVNAGFVTNLSDLLQHADLWLHGHVHDSFDYQVAGCRVAANPRGYPKNRRTSATVGDLLFENEAFERSCVIDTNDLPSSLSARRTDAPRAS